MFIYLIYLYSNFLETVSDTNQQSCISQWRQNLDVHWRKNLKAHFSVMIASGTSLLQNIAKSEHNFFVFHSRKLYFERMGTLCSYLQFFCYMICSVPIYKYSNKKKIWNLLNPT